MGHGLDLRDFFSLNPQKQVGTKFLCPQND